MEGRQATVTALAYMKIPTDFWAMSRKSRGKNATGAREMFLVLLSAVLLYCRH